MISISIGSRGVRMANQLRIANKRLFFLYAHPCGDVLVKRGSMSKETLERIRERLKSGKKIDTDPKLFKVAYALLSMLANERGKRAIDDEILHEYYWRKHDEHVMSEAKIKDDVIPEMCRVFPARVIEVKGRNARVETPVGGRSINIEFVPNVHADDFVTVHYSYACEKIGEGKFKKLWGEKNG
jgi:hydrogenase maturation factor